MNKFLIGLTTVFALLLTIFFFMWRNVSLKNEHLTSENTALNTKIERIEQTLTEKEITISEQNKKYQSLLNTIKYNECENMPVSDTLVQAAKGLQE